MIRIALKVLNSSGCVFMTFVFVCFIGTSDFTIRLLRLYITCNKIHDKFVSGEVSWIWNFSQFSTLKTIDFEIGGEKGNFSCSSLFIFGNEQCLVYNHTFHEEFLNIIDWISFFYTNVRSNKPNIYK